MERLTPDHTKPCECGCRIRWETRLTRCGPMWLGLCIRICCGQISLFSPGGTEGDPPQLADFLGVSRPHPYVKPWLRLFLQVAAGAEPTGWRPTGGPCWMCSQTELVMALGVYRDNINDAVLCIYCGVTAVRTAAPDYSGFSVTYGLDWATPDEGVRLLRDSARLVASGPATD